MSNNNLSLEKALQSYQVYSAPRELSWKKHYVDETYTSPSLIECPLEERQRFSNHLTECQCTICDSIRATSGETKTLLDLVNILTCKPYENIPKLSRRVIYSSSNGERPIGNRAFELWNGWQIMDLDIKNREIAEKLKEHIFKALCGCNWFLGVVFSSSGKGLHVYTKITVSEEEKFDLQKRKLLYLTNFRHKYSFVYIACLQIADKIGFTKDDLQRWMDLAMFKPQQGAFIGYDPKPLINTGFFEDYIYVCFDELDDQGVDWVTHPDLRAIFKRWEWFEDTNEEAKIEIIDSGENSTKNINTNKYHYKHNERWKLANTLVKIYGLEKGYKYLRKICDNATHDKELMADCTTALRHNKDVDPWAISCLNSRHGFKIKVDVKNASEISQEELFIQMDTLENPNNIVKSNNYVEFYIKKDEYLGSILEDIMEKLGDITLLEAGPGLGKTEMVKQIASRGDKVMMVMPFTSTIKSKVEEDASWYYSYGARKPKLDVEQGLALTLDKFSHLEPMDIKANNFKYVFIDESHLLFMSDYRSIMSRVVDMVRMMEVPVILMSGTPTGELVFFNNITHILVKKEETRKKDLHVNIYNNPQSLIYAMTKDMAKDIVDGKRILYPSNLGMLYGKQIEASIKHFLQVDHQWFGDINFRYYKKSEIGEMFMDDINFRKTVKNINVLMCTSYLSVGVDILDKLNFTIYFRDLCTASEADQWANRLRSNDLHIKLYVSKYDGEGNYKNINKYRPMNFRLDDEELKDMHSIIRICNGTISRSPIVNNYNPLVSSIISSNNYVMFDEINQKYYIDETAYKICQFEHKYRDFAQQLPVFMKGMKMYGYEITSKDYSGTEEIEVNMEWESAMKTSLLDTRDWNTRTVTELIDLMTWDRLDIYKDAMQGKFDIRKAAIWKEDFNKNIIYCKNVEMFEKVVPIFLSFSKTFDIPEIKEIFNACKRKSGYNFSALMRLRAFFNLLNAQKNKRLDLPIKKFMDEVYKISEKKTIKKSEYHSFIEGFSTKYALMESTKIINITQSTLTMKRITEIFDKLFKCLVECTYPHKDEIHMKRVEPLWKTRQEKFSNTQSNIYIITDFISDMKEIEEGSTIEINRRDDENDIGFDPNLNIEA